MTSLCLGDLFLERADGLAIVAGGNRRYCSFQRTGFLDALGPHVFEKLRPDLGLLDQLENGLGLSFVECASDSVIIIADNHDVEDVAGDMPASFLRIRPFAALNASSASFALRCSYIAARRRSCLS